MKKYLVIGNHHASGESIEVKNPYDDSTVGHVVSATKDQTRGAIEGAQHAFRKFKFTTAEDKREMLTQLSNWVKKNKKSLALTMAKESGKPVKACESEVKGTGERLSVAASEVFFNKGETIRTKGKVATVFREPLGVVSAIGPFNYPFFAVVAKVAPAIAAGNTVVAKPATDDPLTFMEFADAAREILPPGVMNSLTGSGSKVGGEMVSNIIPKMIAFTGSYEVGKWIAENAGMKRLHLELGGKAPAIVLPDANLDLAAKEIANGSLGLSGQRCNALSITMAHDEIKEELTEKIVKEVARFKVGDQLKKGVDVGPLINHGAVKSIKTLIEDAISRGAIPLTEYKVEKNIVYPLVLDKVDEHMKIANEETFGPVIPIMQFRDLDWLISHFNALPYRLDSSLFTESARQVFYVERRLDEGSIHINGAPFHSLGVFPYGESPGAGMGREGLLQTMKEMTTLKTVVWGNLE
ncbi:MAG: aldehyde dehydrogenase family protein [Candidatus Altiarchaeota archaeon]|nr:aldehyde dehydrogenase family protein [Candidatus Altiarchaeota archaeon]